MASTSETESKVTIKVCCSCGKNLAGKKRMRDSEGRYWCVECGKKDEERKRGKAGVACASCGDSFPAGDLKTYGVKQYCKPCYKRLPGNDQGSLLSRLFSSGGGGSSDEASPSDRKRNITLIVVLVAVGLFSVYWNFLRDPYADDEETTAAQQTTQTDAAKDPPSKQSKR